MNRKINQEGLELIKHFESLLLICHDDGYGVASIGYGNTNSVTKADIGKKKITEKEADALFKLDIRDAELGVQRYIDVELTDNQFAALVSFTFNLGTGRLIRSTLRSKLNNGDYKSVPSELNRWVYADGIRSAGLVRRRKEEGVLFNKGEEHKKYADMDVRELTSECVDKDNEIEDLKGKIKELNGKFVDLEQRIMSAMEEIQEMGIMVDEIQEYN